MELTCFILHLLVKRTRFVRYHTSCSRKGLPEARGTGDHGTGYRVHHDVTAEDIRFVSQEGVPPLAPGVPLELSTGVPSPPPPGEQAAGAAESPPGQPGP